jgi:hypothetical protein
MMNGPEKRLPPSHSCRPSFATAGSISVRLVLCLIAGLTAKGCAQLSARPLPPTVDVTGFWEGGLIDICAGRMSGCGGIVRISLSMIQNESGIMGMYRCATASAVCRNLHTQGQIAAGEVRGGGVSLRIMFEDVSSCIFNGIFSNDAGGGAYICMQGGGMIDRGYWRVQRAYGPSPPPA